jgi:hypothetical protein
MNATYNLLAVAGSFARNLVRCQVRSATRVLASLLLLCALSTVTTNVSAITLSPGDLVISDIGNDRLLRVNSTGTFAEVISAGGLIDGNSGLRINRDSGAIYVANQLGTAASTGKIIQVTTPGGVATQTTVADGHGADNNFATNPNGELRHPRDVAFQPNGQLAVVERSFAADGVTGRNGILRADLTLNQYLNQSIVKVGAPFVDPAAITVASNNYMFMGDLAGLNVANTALWHVSPDGLTVASLDGLISGGLQAVAGVQVATSDSLGRAMQLFVAEYGNGGGTDGAIYRIDLAYAGLSNTITSATRTLVSNGVIGTPMIDPTALALGEDGTLYVTDGVASRVGIYRILNPLTSPSTSFFNFNLAGGGVNFANFVGNGIDVYYLNPLPAPEPSTGLLLVCGVIAMTRRASRQRRLAVRA